MTVDLKSIVAGAVDESIQKLRYNLAHDVTEEMKAKMNRYLILLCVFIPSPISVGTLLMEVSETSICTSFFEFELKLTVAL